MNGAELIELERRRQPHEADLQWDEDQLAAAAAVYAAPFEVYRYDGRNYRRAWTWPIDWDHRDKFDRFKQLQIAGAWCAAEIDRRLIKEMRKRRYWPERLLAAWFMYRFKFRLGFFRSLWAATRLSFK